MTTFGYSSTAKSGRVVVGEFDGMFQPRTINGADRYPAVAFHGAAGDWFQWFSSTLPRMQQLLTEAANGGIPSVAARLGGDTWGNPTGVGHADTARTAIATASGASNTKVHLIGASMGAACALEYAIAHPTRVASMTLCIPLCDLIGMYEANTGGFRAAIGTAWGVTYPTPLPAGADILAQAEDMEGIPTRFYYAPDDPLIDPADVTALATAMGSAAEAIATDGGGHTDAGLLPTDFDWDEWVTWLTANGG